MLLHKAFYFKLETFFAQISLESESKCNLESIGRDPASYCALHENAKAFSWMPFQLKEIN